MIVADNGSEDRTVHVAEEFSGRLRLRVVDASRRKGPGAARNDGVRVSGGATILFCDADDVVMPDWVGALAECVVPGAVAVGAIRYLDFDTDGFTVPTDWQTDRTALPRYLGQLPLTYSSNLGVTRADFERVGGFDESLRCGQDADLGIRLGAAGCDIEWCPAARVVMRDRASARSQFRQFVRYGRWDVAIYRKHRDVALRRPPVADALRDYGSLLFHLPRLLDRDRRRSWIVTAGQRIGRLIGSVRERTLLP